MREILRIALNNLQGQPFPVDIEVSKEDREPEIRTRFLRADRIIDEVSFLTPRNAPFLQIVDACAFGLRRYLARQSQDEDYLYSVSGARAPHFLLFNLTGSAAYSIVYILLGYFFGKKWKLLQAWLGPTVLYVILAGITLIVLGIIFRHTLSRYAARLSSKGGK